MDYDIWIIKYVLGFVLFNSNQIYDTLLMLRMISTMYSRLYEDKEKNKFSYIKKVFD